MKAVFYFLDSCHSIPDRTNQRLRSPWAGRQQHTYAISSRDMGTRRANSGLAAAAAFEFIVLLGRSGGRRREDCTRGRSSET